MFQRGERVRVQEDITYMAPLHGQVGEITEVFPNGASWTYGVTFPGEGEIMMYHFELDRVAETD